MLPSHDKDSLAIVSFFVDWLADHKSLDGAFAEGTPDGNPGDYFFLSVALFSQVLIQFLDGVGVGVSNVKSVVFVWGADLENQLVVHSA